MSKIVVVDDEKMVTMAFKTLFRVEGYSDVHLFNNPKEAVDFLKCNKPDLIISDFQPYGEQCRFRPIMSFDPQYHLLCSDALNRQVVVSFYLAFI